MYSCNVILRHVLVAVCVWEHFYTMGHKKGATLFLTITLEVFEQFLRFLCQWKQE